MQPIGTTASQEGTEGRLFGRTRLSLRLESVEGSGLHGGWTKNVVQIACGQFIGQGGSRS